MSVPRLGVVKEIVEATGLGVSYAYEDLVFLDNNAVLLQFTNARDTVLLHTNQEAAKEQLTPILAAFKQEARARAMSFLDGGQYALSQGEGENINIEFIP